MKPALTPLQAHLIRAVGKALSLSGVDLIDDGRHDRKEPTPIVEQVTTREWSSLTFTGQRHYLDLHFAGAASVDPPRLSEDMIVVPQHLIAVERFDVRRAGDGWCVHVALMTIDDISSFT